jgi:hypothetical protein
MPAASYSLRAIPQLLRRRLQGRRMPLLLVQFFRPPPPVSGVEPVWPCMTSATCPTNVSFIGSHCLSSTGKAS